MILLLVLSLFFRPALFTGPAAGKIGGSCSAGTDCDDTTNAKCVASICTCNDGYNAASGADTCAGIQQGKVNAACDAQKTCSATNAACVGGFCTCNSGWIGAKGDDNCAGIQQGKVNAVCDAQKTCSATNAACVGGFCTCNSGWIGAKGDDHCDKDPNSQQGGATTTSFSSLLYFFVGMTSVAAIIAQ